MAGTLQDFRYATRGLRKNPGFLIVAALTLALGIGANVAVFGVMNAILLNPTGIPHPDSVVALRSKYSFVPDLLNINMSPPDFADALAGKDVFTSAAVEQLQVYNYNPNGTTPERLVGAQVSWQWFDVFWAHPQLGRVFRPEEDMPNADHEVILSYAAWQDRFGGDPAIVGKSLLLNQESFQIIGVMQPEFDWPNGTEVWTPIALPPGRYYDANYRHNESLFAVARMRPTVTLKQANAYLALKTAQNIVAEGPNGFSKKAGWGMFSVPLIDFVAGNLRKPLTILLMAVMTVLLIVCANIAGLQLARASARQHEISIQIALGAGSGRLAQQALLESFLLGVVGVLLGLAVAHFGTPVLLLLAPQSLAGNLSVHMGGPVLFYASAVALICVLLCGTAPAWHMIHSRWFHILQEGGRSGTTGGVRQRLRSVLVVGEIAMATLLLVGAALLVRSLEKVEQLETGFNPHNLMTGAVSLAPTVYKSDEQQVALYVALEQELKNLPGVTGVALADALPFTNKGGSASFSIKGRNYAPDDPGPHGNNRNVSPGYFEALGIPLVRGRQFNSEDRLNTEPVAIIDETLARQYWPNEDPLGQHINPRDSKPGYTIVGIVKHAKATSLESDTNEGFYYYCINQRPVPAAGIAVRANSSRPENLTPALQSAVRRVDPNQPLYDLKTMDQRVDASLVSRRFLVILLSIFAGLALLLAALGLYGVISYAVRLRTREIGIRVALGAERRDVLRMILGQGLRLTTAGLCLGFIATLIAGRVLSSLLYNVGLFNPLALLITSAVLITTVMFASYLPAHWATRVEPTVALREQ